MTTVAIRLQRQQRLAVCRAGVHRRRDGLRTRREDNHRRLAAMYAALHAAWCRRNNGWPKGWEARAS